MIFRSSPPITLKAQLLVWLAQPHQLRAFSRAIKAIVVVMALALSTRAGYAQGLTLDFASSPSDSVIFGGTNNTFQFNAKSSHQWVITGESGGSSAVPEPASLTLSILGGFGLLYFSVRKSRRI